MSTLMILLDLSSMANCIQPLRVIEDRKKDAKQAEGKPPPRKIHAHAFAKSDYAGPVFSGNNDDFQLHMVPTVDKSALRVRMACKAVEIALDEKRAGRSIQFMFVGKSTRFDEVAEVLAEYGHSTAMVHDTEFFHAELNAAMLVQ